MCGCNPQNLKENICNSSMNKKWPDAVMEWKVSPFNESNGPQNCTCGRLNINEIYILENFFNDSSLIIGKVCSKKIRHLQKYLSLLQMSFNPQKRLNDLALFHAAEKNWINQKQMDDYYKLIDIEENNLNPEQKEKILQINKYCIRNMKEKSDEIENAIILISADIKEPINKDVALYARLNGIIEEWDFFFSLDTWKLSWIEMSPNQQKKRKSINEKIIHTV